MNEALKLSVDRVKHDFLQFQLLKDRLDLSFGWRCQGIALYVIKQAGLDNMGCLVIEDKDSSISSKKRERSLDGLILVFEIVVDEVSHILEFLVGQFNVILG